MAGNVEFQSIMRAQYEFWSHCMQILPDGLKAILVNECSKLSSSTVADVGGFREVGTYAMGMTN